MGDDVGVSIRCWHLLVLLLLWGIYAEGNGTCVCRDMPSAPFRCLEAQYRRELVRVYLSNVDALARKFVEEKREALLSLRSDPCGFMAFWAGLDAKRRRQMATASGEVILKVGAPHVGLACTLGATNAARWVHAMERSSTCPWWATMSFPWSQPIGTMHVSLTMSYEGCYVIAQLDYGRCLLVASAHTRVLDVC